MVVVAVVATAWCVLKGGLRDGYSIDDGDDAGGK